MGEKVVCPSYQSGDIMQFKNERQEKNGVVKLLGVIRKIKNYDVIELYIRNETETAK